MAERLVIVGAGMAAARLVKSLTTLAPAAFDITLIGAEPSPPYDRIQLSSVLAGERAVSDLGLLDEATLNLPNLQLRLGSAVQKIDTAGRRAFLTDGHDVAYDKLVLANGSAPIRLPLPGANLPGVMTFRDLGDVEALAEAEGEAVVIGGGLLGLEAAHGLARRGLGVTVVHLMPWLMERQLDREAGDLLREELERRGLAFELEAVSEAIIGENKVEGLKLKDGRTLPCDLLVMAVGIRPEKSLAEGAGLVCNRGVVVDDQLRTSATDIHAIGECAEHQGTCYGLVWPVNEQADVLAAHLSGDQGSAYRGSAIFTSLKISGVDLFSAGRFADEEVGERLTLRDSARGIYRRLIVDQDRLKGAVLLGDAADGAWYASLIRQSAPIKAFRDRVMFGEALANAQTSVPAE